MGAFSEFDEVRGYMERVWERLTGGRSGPPRFRPAVIEPPADVYETADAVVVVIEIPGLRGPEVELSIADGELVVRGEKSGRDCLDQRERVYTQMEIARGPFECRVPLPVAVDGQGSSLRYEDGLLEITLPKRQTVTFRRIRVTVRGG